MYSLSSEANYERGASLSEEGSTMPVIHAECPLVASVWIKKSPISGMISNTASPSNWHKLPSLGIIAMQVRLKIQAYYAVGPIAQSVEQRTFNPWVDGSSPSGPTP